MNSLTITAIKDIWRTQKATERFRYVICNDKRYLVRISVHSRRKRCHVASRFDLGLPLYSASRRSQRDFLRSRNLITDEVELRVNARALLGKRSKCWWPAEVALIHRNFTGCQAGLTGLCHGSNAEESHPTEISVSLLRLLSVRAATESWMNLDVVSIYLWDTYAGFITALLPRRSIRNRSGDLNVTFVVTY